MKQLVPLNEPPVPDKPLLKFIKRTLLIAALISLIPGIILSGKPGVKNSILPPVAICKNITVPLGPDGSVTIAASEVNNGSNDPDGVITNLMVTPSLFDCSSIGPNTVVLTVTDNEGLSSTCNAIVTITDNTPPVVNLKPAILVIGSSGTATLTTTDVDNGSYDNCGTVTLSLSKTTFTCADLGENTVTLTATDSHGNSSSANATVTVSSTLNITGMSLNSCDLAPSLALFEADIEGGDGTYSFLWQGVESTSMPFMLIIPFPPSLQFFNTSTLEKPFFNNTMPDGIYNIRFVTADGNGCVDTSVIRIRKTGVVFNNVTMRYSEACEGEVMTYSVNNDANALYSWSVENGTILTSDQNASSIEVRWDMGALDGVVTATLQEPNSFFPAGQCESSVVDSVTLIPVPSPAFNNPAINACAGTENTYSLTGTYPFQIWSVNGGFITSGGGINDSFVNVRWGTGPTGTISVTAGNSSLCMGSVMINVSVFNLSGTITNLTDISCNEGSDGSVTATATPGTGQPPYSYSIDGSGIWQLTGTFNGLAIGNHTLTIRDNLLCTFDLPFVLSQPSEVSGIIQNQTNVSCFGGTDGSVTISASGGTSPYQYSLNAGAYQDQNIFTGLAAGNYTVTVRDSHNCTATLPVTITQPAAALNGTVTVTNVACFGDLTGRADLTVSGGVSPYTYAWSNGATTEDLLNVAAGNYTVIITDSGGCTATLPVTITQPAAAIAFSTTAVNVLCFGESTGAINLTVSGGTSPYSFLWSNGALTEDLSGVTAGTYSVIITDGNSCTATTSATVSGPSAALSGSVTSQTNILCRGESNGSVTVAGSGGTGAYEYRIGAGTYQSTGTFGSLTAGSYNITIRDANLCTFNLPVTITEPALSLSGSVGSRTDVLCFGAATGSITIAAAGGTSPYQFNVDGGAFQSSPVFGNLASGSHIVIIRDVNLCSFTLPVTITQPSSALGGNVVSQTNVSCFGAATGSVTVAGSGGTSPYTYSIDGGAFNSSGTFSSLTAGSHNVTVRDLNLCQLTVPVTITQPAAALSATTTGTNVSCFGENNGSATATATGGTPPYSYSWNTTPVRTTQTISGLLSGSYTVTVTDHNGCTASSTVVITQPAGPLTGVTSVTAPDCHGNSTGSIDLTVTNGTAPVSFLWNTGSTSEDLTAIPAGSYSVSITDANGCTAGATATVDQPAILSAAVTVADAACFGGSSGSCNLDVTGGTPPYAYLWSNNEVTRDISNISAGDYSVTVTDANGCTTTANATVDQPATPVTGSVVSVTDVTVFGGNDGSVTVSGSGGTSPLEYSIDDGPYQPSGTFSALTAGDHIVTVRDAHLCTFNITFNLTQPYVPLAVLIESQSDVPCNGGSGGSVTVGGWGGILPYEFSVDQGTWQESGVFSSLTAGTHEFAVRDAIDSVAYISATLAEPSEIVITSSNSTAACPDSHDASISLTISGGIGPYNVLWSDGVTTQNRNNIGTGTYSVIVTDQNMCAMSHIVEVDFTGSFDCVVIPQLITPNNDGYNDEWIIRNIDIYPDAEIRVYNRWGKLVFRSRNISADRWNGTSDGKPLPTDSYHYILYLNDGTPPKSGVISVIR